MATFGSQLRRLRQRAGLSQESLATRAGLSTEAVSLLERGRRTPRATTLRLLADALGLPEAERSDFVALLAPAEPVRRQLPAQPSALLGRNAEVAQLAALLRDEAVRLVTVSGAGGVGKTRVALAAAEEVADAFPAGVRWLPIATVGEPTALAPALAAALGIRPLDTAEPAALVEHLGALRLLLVIDGAEHLLAEVRAICLAILAGAPGVTIVLTSRHRLQDVSETVVPLHPLEMPESAADIADAPASQLFLTRAGRPADSLDGQERDALVRICCRLDGLPLALELAAARTGVLGLVELADLLDRSLAILHIGDNEALSVAVVGWSYGLLTGEERAVFAELAVFAGSFDRNAVAAVTGLDDAAVLATLEALVAGSLLERNADAGGHARFRLLQVVKDFALTRLDSDHAESVLRDRHARHVAALVARAAPHLAGPDQARWLAVLDREISEIRQAVGWLTSHDPVRAQEMVGSLWRWCYLRGRYAEGRAWAAAALAAAPTAPPRIRATALAGDGVLAFLQCEYALAEVRISQCQDLYAELGDRAGVAWCLSRLGAIARERGQYAVAIDRHREALALLKGGEDDSAVAVELNLLAFVHWLSGDLDEADQLAGEALETATIAGETEGIAWSLINLGAVARHRGDLASARLLLQHGLEVSEESGFREGVAWTLDQLGGVARELGEVEDARPLLVASIAEHTDLGDRWRLASVLDEAAAVELADGSLALAAARLRAADRLRRAIGVPVPFIERAGRAATEAACRELLGSAYEAAALAGRAWS